MLRWCIWRSHDCLRPTLIWFMNKFAWVFEQIDAFLLILYTDRSVHWCRSYRYPIFGFQFLPRRIVMIGLTIVCCPREQSSCRADIAANSSALHWCYAFVLHVVGFSQFFYISWLRVLTQVRISFVVPLILRFHARAWSACRSLWWSLHNRATYKFRVRQRWSFVIINLACVLAPNAVKKHDVGARASSDRCFCIPISRCHSF